jgi:alpha-glucosidase
MNNVNCQNPQLVDWWRNAIIYQVYPRSFYDSNGDGIGDIPGIIDHLDYITALGVDAIWLCPFFESSMDDFGYDVTDMYTIDPDFGTLEDFDQLLADAHNLGLKVIIDQVWNHTSDQHPWFLESRQSRDNPKADWYVWADPQDDGSPPNNWLSVFLGKSAWVWAPQREQFYFYDFLEFQPKLNLHNPQVVDAIFKCATFWLERGVDGFRLDAVNFLIHDPKLQDNPPRPEDASPPDGILSANPIAKQLFHNQICDAQNYQLLQQIRQHVDCYEAITLGEVTLSEDAIAISSDYVTGSERLHLVYNSALFFENPFSATQMRQTLERIEHHFPDGGNCWIAGNHDYRRLKSRWTGKDAQSNPYPEEFYHAIAAMLLSLPGALCLYQGDELGLTDAEIPDDIPAQQIKDSFGQALYPDIPGRDASRTPMPWQADAANAGFTEAKQPWLPIPEEHIPYAVDVQHKDSNSLLNTWRRLLHWRKQQPALIQGETKILQTQEPLLAFIRDGEQQRLLCLFNWSDVPTHYDLSDYPQVKEFKDSGFTADRQGDTLKLPAYGVFFAELF